MTKAVLLSIIGMAFARQINSAYASDPVWQTKVSVVNYCYYYFYGDYDDDDKPIFIHHSASLTAQRPNTKLATK